MSRPGASSGSLATDWNAESNPVTPLRLVNGPAKVSNSQAMPSKTARGLRNVWNALGYNFFWWIGVSSAVRGDVWTGLVAMSIFVGIAIHWTPVSERAIELRFLLVAMFVGWGIDSLLHNFGAILYPSSATAWPFFTSPPWIAALWLGFATMPRYSLGWLKRRPLWFTAAFGAIGGPIAFYAGTKLGAIEAGFGLGTYAVLAVEYAILTAALVLRHDRLR